MSKIKAVLSSIADLRGRTPLKTLVYFRYVLMLRDITRIKTLSVMVANASYD
jgi:hypothetical protein